MLTVALVRRKAELFFNDYLRRLAQGDEATLFPWAVAGTLPSTAAELTALLREEMPRLRELAAPQRVHGKSGKYMHGSLTTAPAVRWLAKPSL